MVSWSIFYEIFTLLKFQGRVLVKIFNIYYVYFIFTLSKRVRKKYMYYIKNLGTLKYFKYDWEYVTGNSILL